MPRALALAALALLAGRPASAAEAGPDAVWEPSRAVLKALDAQCKAKPVADVKVCMLAYLQGAGASPAALGFARRLGGEGFLSAFKETGRVDVARVLRPFRADAAESVVLVNGDPALVEVMDPALIDPLLKDKRLAEFVAAGATLWPGYPEPGLKPLAGGGQHFIFSLRVRACRACADLAKAFVGYDFDASGKFLGARLLGVRKPSAFSVSGEVAQGQAFAAPIDSSTTFRLEPFPEGWTIAVKDASGKDYCALVTPPFHGPNALAVYGWHFKPGKNAPGKVRDFRCVETPEQYRAASDAVNAYLWGPTAGGRKATAALERAMAAARAGRLTITALTLGGAAGDEAPPIATMSFRFELGAP